MQSFGPPTPEVWMSLQSRLTLAMGRGVRKTVGVSWGWCIRKRVAKGPTNWGEAGGAPVTVKNPSDSSPTGTSHTFWLPQTLQSLWSPAPRLRHALGTCLGKLWSSPIYSGQREGCWHRSWEGRLGEGPGRVRLQGPQLRRKSFISPLLLGGL